MSRNASVVARPPRSRAPEPPVERASAALGIGRHRRPTVTGGQLPALTGLRGLAATLVFVRLAYT
nr:hypothetical protein [Micromonospora sp. DSM 115978]